MNSDYYVIDETVKKKKTTDFFNNFKETIAVKKLLLQISYLFLGFATSRGTIFGGYSPFSAAFVASVPMNGIVSATVGVIAGCFFPMPVTDTIRYISSILAIVAIRWTLNDFTILKNKVLFSPLVALLPLMVTGIVMCLMRKESDPNIILLYGIEALIAGATAYFFSKAFNVIFSPRGLSVISQQETTSVILSACVVILAISGIEINNISVGHIVAIVTIMVCSYFGSVSGGAISGVATGLIFSLQSASLGYISGAYAIGGLLAGVFSPAGKLAIIFSFVVSNSIVAIQSGDFQTVATVTVEAVIASAIFFIIPKKWLINVKKLFENANADKNLDAVKDNTIMKLDFSADAISNVSDTIDDVAQRLKQINVYSPEKIYRNVCDGVCRHCGIKTLCWNKEYDRTIRSLEEVVQKLQKKDRIEISDLPYYMNERCSSARQIVRSINNSYRDYSSRQEADRRVDQVRNAVNNQFLVMGAILKNLSYEIDDLTQFNSYVSERIENFLREKNVPVTHAICKIDNNEHMFVEIEVAGEISEKKLGENFQKFIGKICGCKMDKPLISSSKYSSRIQLNEKTPYRVSYATKQHSCNNKKMCGDSLECFNDGLGNSVFIISDGMGSGGRAAIDGAMATGIMARLVKSGLDPNLALKLANSSVFVKSQEESLATLDVLYIDRFTGFVNFLKAGATTTFVRKDDKCIKVEAPSLPIGILDDVEFSSIDMELGDNDRIIMVSDGATAFGDEWIEKELSEWKDESEKEIADRIINQSKIMRNDERDDDITVIAIKISDRSFPSDRL